MPSAPTPARDANAVSSRFIPPPPEVMHAPCTRPASILLFSGAGHDATARSARRLLGAGARRGRPKARLRAGRTLVRGGRRPAGSGRPQHAAAAPVIVLAARPVEPAPQPAPAPAGL